MSRKLVFIISGISAVLVTVVLIVFLKLKPGIFTSPVAKIQPTPVVVVEMATWTDPAEFTFQYPKSLVLNPHNEDQTNYAHVELTSATYSGSLIVWVKDTDVQTIDGWVSQQKAKDAIDSNLGGAPAKKILTTGEVNKLIISTIQGGYLYQIETNLVDLPAGEAGRDFWNKTLDTVTSSFKFTPSGKNTGEGQVPASSADQGSDTGGTDEEVIQ